MSQYPDIVFRSGHENKVFIDGMMLMEHLRGPLPEVDPLALPIWKGCRVHLKNKGGHYEVVSCNSRTATITCQIWKNQKAGGQRDIDYAVIRRSDVKCLHG
jgi:hypothetical protein